MRPPRLPRRAARSLLLLALVTTDCAPSGPVAPVTTPEPGAASSTDFGANQRARLDRLHAALADPAAPDLSSGLVVRLAFDDAADLDLFVTDPTQESVYFANTPTRSGGRLVDDRRCDDPEPRVEAVHFRAPLPGRYRVGVDFHRRCEQTALSSDAAKEGLYVVRVDEDGRVLEREGMLTQGRFEVIVIEFDVE